MILLASFIVKMIEGRIRLCVSFFSCFGGVVRYTCLIKCLCTKLQFVTIYASLLIMYAF